MAKDTAGSSEAELDAALPDIDWLVAPPGATRGWFDAPSGRLATLSMGDPSQPRVVLVPGVTGSKEDFVLMAPLLAEAGYRVLSFDLAGQFESAAAGPHDPSAPFTYDLFVADLVAILESGGTGASHVLGYSFAATVAQITLSRRPDLFASLTLLSCPPQPGQGFRGMKRVGWFSGLASGTVAAGLMLWGLRRNLTHVPPGRVRLVLHRLKFTNRKSVDDVIGLMMRSPDLRAAVAATSIPKLVAVGEHDLWPLELHAAFASQIGARLAVYPAGHSPCEESPHQLCRDMIALLSRA